MVTDPFTLSFYGIIVTKVSFVKKTNISKGNLDVKALKSFKNISHLKFKIGDNKLKSMQAGFIL